MGIKRDTSEPVPARGRLGPVQIDDPHLEVGFFGALEKQHPVRAGALMGLADLARESKRVLYDPATVIHHHKIIPRSDHLVKRNCIVHD